MFAYKYRVWHHYLQLRPPQVCRFEMRLVKIYVTIITLASFTSASPNLEKRLTCIASGSVSVYVDAVVEYVAVITLIVFGSLLIELRRVVCSMLRNQSNRIKLHSK